jgi:hypothetical protein
VGTANANLPLLLLLVPLAVFLALAPARGLFAVDAPQGYSSDRGLPPLLFEAAGYLTESYAVDGRPGWRGREAALKDGGTIGLSLLFSGVDPWPKALELDRKGPGGARGLSDSAPFGGNLGKGESAFLKEGLGLFLDSLRPLRKTGKGEPRALGPGLSLERVPLSYGVRMGPPELLVIRADPKIWGLYPYSEGEDPRWKGEPADIAGWAKRLKGASLVLTGPQYYADRSSMGYLKRKGTELEPKSHPSWKGYMGHSAAFGGSPFRISDLASDDKEGLSGHHTLLQSFMLMDRRGVPRVRDTDRLSSRVAVAETRDGSIAILFCQGSISLRDLALLLPGLGLYPAIGMDGGLQGQLAIKEGEGFDYLWGEYSHNVLGNVKISNYHPSLPFVLALEPLSGGGG